MKIRKLGFVLASMGLVSALSGPVLAAPVEMKQVRQILKGDYRQGGDNTSSIDLRLVGEGDEKKPAATAQDPNNPNGAMQEKPGAPQEEVIEEVTVESCDCPQPPLPPPPTGRGFPKWLLGLGALPLVCLTGVCTNDNPPNVTPPGGGPNATPTPGGGGPPPTPEPPIPEPATILLFGSGLMALGAAARRRRNNNSDES
jgi:hypothetical protein